MTLLKRMKWKLLLHNRKRQDKVVDELFKADNFSALIPFLETIEHWKIQRGKITELLRKYIETESKERKKALAILFFINLNHEDLLADIFIHYCIIGELEIFLLNHYDYWIMKREDLENALGNYLKDHSFYESMNSLKIIMIINRDRPEKLIKKVITHKANYKLTFKYHAGLSSLPKDVFTCLKSMQDREYSTKEELLSNLTDTIGHPQTNQYKLLLLKNAEYGRFLALKDVFHDTCFWEKYKKGLLEVVVDYFYKFISSEDVEIYILLILILSNSKLPQFISYLLDLRTTHEDLLKIIPFLLILLDFHMRKKRSNLAIWGLEDKIAEYLSTESNTQKEKALELLLAFSPKNGYHKVISMLLNPKETLNFKGFVKDNYVWKKNKKQFLDAYYEYLNINQYLNEETIPNAIEFSLDVHHNDPSTIIGDFFILMFRAKELFMNALRTAVKNQCISEVQRQVVVDELINRTKADDYKLKWEKEKREKTMTLIEVLGAGILSNEKIETYQCINDILNVNCGETTATKEAIVKIAGIRSQEAVQPLMNIFSQWPHKEAEEILKLAAWALGEIRNNKAVKTLVSNCSVIYDSVRKESVVALGKIKCPSCVDDLKKQLSYGPESFRKAVIWALGEIGHPDAIESLITILEYQDLHHKEATDSLIKIGKPSIDKLIATFEPKDDFNNYYHYSKETFQEKVIQILKSLTGKEFESDYVKWKNWWASNRKTFVCSVIDTNQWLMNKSKEELLEIWEKRDGKLWTDETFDVLERVFASRNIFLNNKLAESSRHDNYKIAKLVCPECNEKKFSKVRFAFPASILPNIAVKKDFLKNACKEKISNDLAKKLEFLKYRLFKTMEELKDTLNSLDLFEDLKQLILDSTEKRTALCFWREVGVGLEVVDEYSLYCIRCGYINRKTYYAGNSSWDVSETSCPFCKQRSENHSILPDYMNQIFEPYIDD